MLFSECKDNFLKYKINTIQIKKIEILKPYSYYPILAIKSNKKAIWYTNGF